MVPGASAAAILALLAGGTTGQNLIFKGPVTDANATKILAELGKGTYTSLTVSSFGGSEDAAIRIARAIHRMNIRVVVDGVCMSACAQYILLSAPSATIRPGSLVALHSSSYALHGWSSLHARSEPDYARLAEASEKTSRETVDLLGNPRKLEMLSAALYALGPICIEPAAQGPKAPRVATRFHFWVPGADTLKEVGIDVGPDWPRTHSQARSFMAGR